MKIGIVGSRDYNDYYEFRKYIDSFREHIEMNMIISGGATGVDSMAYRYAVEKGITFVCHPPIPEEGFPRAFFRRNLRIVAASETILAFPKGKSSGTRHTISVAKKLNIPCYVVEVKDPPCNHLPAEFDYICMKCKKTVNKLPPQKGI
jgi:predicted Rossmann fold nucleotide-binding protein DprA/Smf involved in DNA uptake